MREELPSLELLLACMSCFGYFVSWPGLFRFGARPSPNLLGALRYFAGKFCPITFHILLGIAFRFRYFAPFCSCFEAKMALNEPSTLVKVGGDSDEESKTYNGVSITDLVA